MPARRRPTKRPPLPVVPDELAARLSARARQWLSEATPHGDGRTVWLGRATKSVTIDGREHVAVGGFDPMTWYSDDEGHIVERDEHGVPFYRADSLAHRIERLSLEREGPSSGEFAVLPGKVGEALAAEWGLVLVPEASDSYQRIWVQAPGAPKCQVVESREPSDYGKSDLVHRTYVYEPRERSPGTTKPSETEPAKEKPAKKRRAR